MRTPLPRRMLAVLAALVVAVTASCGGTDAPEAKRGSSTTRAAASAAPYAVPGPHPVGVTDMRLADGRRVVVWYPTTTKATAGHDRATVDLVGFLNPDLQAKVPDDDRVLYPTTAFRDVAARPQRGGYPVVLFSHGFAGFPEQSASLTTHLASWGYVVAAPDHVERSLDGMLGDAGKGVAPSTDPEVLLATLDLVEATSARSGSVLSGVVDADKVAVTGHSAGASAAYRTASDPRIKAWISYAVGFDKDDGATGTVPPAPDKPGMVMLGTKDGTIPQASSVAVFDAMHHPKYLVEIAGAGHLVFSDLCLIGGSKGGIVKIAERLKLPIPPSLLTLASDGCGPSFPPVDEAFPAIDQASVAFLRSAFGQDPRPIGLSSEVLSSLGTPITLTAG